MNAHVPTSTLTQASHQWASRPDDERFASLTDLAAFAHSVRDNALGRVVSSRKIEARPIEGDGRGLAVMGPDGVSLPTNWAFGQLSERAGAPASYLRKLPPELAADCINYGLVRRDATDTGILMHDAESAVKRLAAVTGPNYGRIWNTDIIDSLINRFGNGVDGAFRVPGEFGVRTTVTKANTTLFASDRDMFVFLADEDHRIEMRDRRNGQPGSLARGFFVWNSEVGAQTFGVATFLFDYVCCNRIVWGAEGYREIKIRHTSAAPDRWIEEVAPALITYSESSTANIVSALEQAKARRVDAVEDFLVSRRFTRNQAAAIQLKHVEEEGRPIETLWDAVTGITAYAREVPHQDARVSLERMAGGILQLAV